ncbi:MAG: glycoside hydrolase family 13 protein [Bacteroidales bacterium]
MDKKTRLLACSCLLAAVLYFSCNNPEKKNPDSETIAIKNVPEWSKNAIWYQIFVERFRNGDPGNDPTRDDIRGTYPDSIPLTWKITPWGQDWYKPDDYFSQSNLSNKWDNLQLRRYGGDLQGVIDKIPYLKDLGITAIYFNPLNDSPSLHKYDPRYWQHIDRNFGPNPQKDKEIIASENQFNPGSWKWTTADSLFLKLIKLCHDNGIKVVMDYSFNHTGKDFWAFNDIKKYGEKSKAADWYEIEKFDDPKTPQNEFTYKGWAGVPTMPEMKKDIVGKKEMPFEGNLHSKGAKEHIFAVAKRWLDPDKDGNPEDGVDGYRLDVAAEVPMGFWREFRKEVRAIKPEAYLVGEIWWKTWPDTLMLPNNFLQGDQFDAIMNYRWYRPARQFFNDPEKSLNPEEFVAELKDKMTGINVENQQAMMNLVASHDAPRISTDLYNKNPYKFKAKPYDDVNYKIDKPDAKTRALQEMILIHQFTYIGAPHIWNGDEMGMWGADDPDCRKPIIWDDIQFEDETHHPFNKPRKTDKVQQDKELIAFYKKLIEIRKNTPALVYGDIVFSLIDNKNEILAYNRKFKSNEIVVIFNKSNNTQMVSVPVSKPGQYKNPFNPNQVLTSENNKLNIKIEGMKALIFMLQ